MSKSRLWLSFPILVLCTATSLMAQAQQAGEKPAVKPDPDQKDSGSKSGATNAEAMAKIGEAAPDFELTGSDGKTYKLSDYKDKRVVVQWVNKDCPVCNSKAATTKANAEKYAAKGVVWLGVDSTWGRTAEQANEYIKKTQFPFPTLLDKDGKVGHLYGAKTTPPIFIIDKGKLVYMGAIDDKKDRSYVQEALDAVLASKEVPLSVTTPYGCSVKYKK